MRFNSLQTGKRIWTVSRVPDIPIMVVYKKFQFPSNGKAYLNLSEPSRGVTVTPVSIPFKRESVSERPQKPTRPWDERVCFNSLQTGKRIWTRWLFRNLQTWQKVSIPFKRESVSEQNNCPSCYSSFWQQFQFPSNGKAYLNTSLGWLLRES